MKRKILGIPFLVIIIFIIVGAGGVAASILIGGGGGAGEVNLQKGLMGQWKMNGNAKDATPYGNNGTLVADAAVTASDRKGQANKAATFDGDGDYINAGNITNLNGLTALTAAAWVKTSSGDVGILGKNSLSGGPFILYISSPNFYVRGATNAYVSGTGIQDGTWHHVAAVYDGSALTLKIYIDGVVKSGGVTGTVPSSLISSADSVTIGWDGSTRYLNGLIDDVRIYNRALSPAEITALYESYDPGIVVSDLQKGLMGQWKMDGNAKDATPYGNNGTVTGAVLAADRKGQANKAYSFDGVDNVVTINQSAMPLGAKTISLWLYKKDTTVDYFFADATGSNEHGDLIYVDTDMKLHWFSGKGTAGTYRWNNLTSISVLAINTWYKVDFTWDGTTDADAVKMYLNGTLDTTGTAIAAESTTPTYSLKIGHHATLYADRSWNGLIDDVRIYNRALSPAEITTLYESYDPGIVVSDLQKGLMGQWKMDGNAKDATPYSNNGTVTGAVLATDRKGQANKAYSFNGTSDYVSVGDTTTFKWLHGASDTTGFQFTISFWVAINDLDETTNYLIFTESGGVAGTGIGLWYNNEAVNFGLRTIYARITRGGVDALVRTQAPDYSYPNDNGWHSVTWTYDQALAENNSKLYIDGVFAVQASKTVQTPSTGNSSSALQFGELMSYTADILNGKLDDVRIYNRVLSQAEITALYESY